MCVFVNTHKDNLHACEARAMLEYSYRQSDKVIVIKMSKMKQKVDNDPHSTGCTEWSL